jgi:hypothetical protein
MQYEQVYCSNSDALTEVSEHIFGGIWSCFDQPKTIAHRMYHDGRWRSGSRRRALFFETRLSSSVEVFTSFFLLVRSKD